LHSTLCRRCRQTGDASRQEGGFRPPARTQSDLTKNYSPGAARRKPKRTPRTQGPRPQVQWPRRKKPCARDRGGAIKSMAEPSGRAPGAVPTHAPEGTTVVGARGRPQTSSPTPPAPARGPQELPQAAPRPHGEYVSPPRTDPAETSPKTVPPSPAHRVPTREAARPRSDRQSRASPPCRQRQVSDVPRRARPQVRAPSLFEFNRANSKSHWFEV